MNILILGGAGFVGANLVRRCLAEPGHEVTVVDSLTPAAHSSLESLRDVAHRIQFFPGDMRDEARLKEWILGKDIIFHCAAQSSHLVSLENPFLDAEINVLVTLKLLEAMRMVNPAAVLVYPSSSTVIGKMTGDMADEDHPERPLELYSAHKGLAERYCRIYHQLYGLKIAVLRFANLYGPYGKNRPEFGFINYFIDRAWKNEPLKVFGAGEQTRNVMYVEDATEMMWQAAFDPALAGGIYFATGPYYLSVREIARQVVEVFGRGRVVHEPWPEERRPIEIGTVRFSSERLRALTGWHPRFDFTAGLERTREILEASADEVLR